MSGKKEGLTYKDSDVLLGEIFDGFVFLPVRHATEVVEEMDVFVLKHSADNAANVYERREDCSGGLVLTAWFWLARSFQ